MNESIEPDSREIRFKRLRMRASHRGMKEMDLILGGFVERLNADAPDELLGGLELLIERPDQELYRLVSTRDDSAVEVPSDYERLERETLNLLRASLRQV